MSCFRSVCPVLPPFDQVFSKFRFFVIFWLKNGLFWPEMVIFGSRRHELSWNRGKSCPRCKENGPSAFKWIVIGCRYPMQHQHNVKGHVFTHRCTIRTFFTLWVGSGSLWPAIPSFQHCSKRGRSQNDIPLPVRLTHGKCHSFFSSQIAVQKCEMSIFWFYSGAVFWVLIWAPNRRKKGRHRDAHNLTLYAPRSTCRAI